MVERHQLVVLGIGWVLLLFRQVFKETAYIQEMSFSIEATVFKRSTTMFLNGRLYMSIAGGLQSAVTHAKLAGVSVAALDEWRTEDLADVRGSTCSAWTRRDQQWLLRRQGKCRWSLMFGNSGIVFLEWMKYRKVAPLQHVNDVASALRAYNQWHEVWVVWLVQRCCVAMFMCSILSVAIAGAHGGS